MEQTSTINGFSPKELFSLYTFLNLYEGKKMKYFKEGELLKRYPALEELKTTTSQFTYEESTKEELTSKKMETLNNELYFTHHISKLLGILYHLRNSIAHAKIRKDGNIVTIEDFEPNNKNPHHTAKGKIPYSAVEDIINIVKTI